MIKKTWKTEDGELIFDFDIFLEEGKRFGLIEVKIYYYNIPDDVCRVTIRQINEKVNFNYLFRNACKLKGYILCEAMPNNQLGVWGDFYYGENLFNHFEGMMIILSSEQPLPPVPIPVQPTEPIEREIISTGSYEDLFPYTYMRKWPKLTSEDLQFNFVQYPDPYESPPVSSTNSFFNDLVHLRESGKPDTRNEMENLAVNYIDGSVEYEEKFINNVNEINGPIKYFSKIDDYIRKTPEFEIEALICEAESILHKEKDEITSYLKSTEYNFEKDSIWQSYFTLIIILGYRYDLLEYFTKTLVMCNLLEYIFLENNFDISIDEIKSLAFATIILPESVFPLPPSTSQKFSSPPEFNNGWIEPYAIGDLQMVRQKFLRYEPGEIAYIENVMKGEKKKIERTKRSKVEDNVTNYNESIDNYKTTDQEETKNLQKELYNVIADNIINTNFQGLQTTYGPPTTANLDGGWSMEIKPNQDTPSKNDIVGFARKVLNQTVNNIRRKVSESRSFSTLNENEEKVTSILDNKNSDKNTRGIYRWLNKVYQAHVINYGNRLMVEMLIPNPAKRFIESENILSDLSFKKPTTPEQNGILKYTDINEQNYANLAAEYKVGNIQPPPPSTKTVSTSLQGEAEQQISIPEGYLAHQAYVTCAFPQNSGSFYVEGVVGTQKFSANQSTTDVPVLTLQNEDTTIPVAVMSSPVASSPPTEPSNYVVSIVVQCNRGENIMNEWQIKTYNAIIEGYERQKNKYYKNVGTKGENKFKSMSPLEKRKIEARTLKLDCIKLLFNRYFELVGHSTRILPDGNPSQFYVNEPRYYQFFQEVFEWQEMVYSFNIYNPDEKPSWLMPEDIISEDEMFAAFLQADTARVIIPVRPGYTMSVLYYLSSGMLWQAENLIAPSNESDTQIVNELKKCGYTSAEINKSIEPWEIVVPTSMHVLQDNSQLPATKY